MSAVFSSVSNDGAGAGDGGTAVTEWPKAGRGRMALSGAKVLTISFDESDSALIRADRPHAEAAVLFLGFGEVSVAAVNTRLVGIRCRDHACRD